MWCARLRVGRPRRHLSLARYVIGSTAQSTPPLFVASADSPSLELEPPRKLYLIAGEPSGDAIGAKVIRALERRRRHGDPPIEYRGIGGPLMCKAGGFDSLLPMQELSVMGLVEVVPHLWQIKRRIDETVRDIEAFQPDLVLTIDSKGFTFRVLKALRVNPAIQNSVKRMHYVAPSVWAYKHRNKKRDFSDLRDLLDAMFVILPFEEGIFNGDGDAPEWCHFVGHPAVEDFFELHRAFDKPRQLHQIDTPSGHRGVTSGPRALLDVAKYNQENLVTRRQLVHSLVNSGVNQRDVRAKFGIPADAFVICALVGSRQNEVSNSVQTVVEAVEKFAKQQTDADPKQVFVVFPTLASVKGDVEAELQRSAPPFQRSVHSDLSFSERMEIFQSSDVAVAVSGTVVLEAALSGIPTVVIYRANALTGWIAKRLAAVRFVSLPNLLLDKSILPELLFSDCTPVNIAQAIEDLDHRGRSSEDIADLAVTVSALARWKQSTYDGAASDVPVRASDLVADHILEVLDSKAASS